MRVLIRELLHKGDKNFWPDPPTEEEIKNYEDFEHPLEGPTVGNFRLDFSHKPLRTSIWNRRAADIFVDQYRLSYLTETRREIGKEFLKRLDRIGREYRQYVESESLEEGPIAQVRGRTSNAAKRQRRRRRIDTVRLQICSLS